MSSTAQRGEAGASDDAARVSDLFALVRQAATEPSIDGRPAPTLGAERNTRSADKRLTVVAGGSFGAIAASSAAQYFDLVPERTDSHLDGASGLLAAGVLLFYLGKRLLANIEIEGTLKFRLRKSDR